MVVMTDASGKTGIKAAELVMKKGKPVRLIGLRRINPGVRVLFMSGFNKSEILQDLLRNDNTRFLQKPFSFEKLMNSMSETLV